MPATEAIRVTCSHCDAHFKVKPEAAGRSVKCPQCRERTQVESTNGNGHDRALAWLGISEEEPEPDPRASAPSPFTPPEPPEPRSAASPPIKIRDQNVEPRQYPALGILRLVYYFFAGLVVILWLLVTIFVIATGLIGGAVADDPAAGGAVMMVAIIPMAIYTVASALIACSLVATAEMIKLALDVQDDTRRAALYASRLPLV